MAWVLKLNISNVFITVCIAFLSKGLDTKLIQQY